MTDVDTLRKEVRRMFKATRPAAPPKPPAPRKSINKRKAARAARRLNRG